MGTERCPTCGQILPAGLSRAELVKKMEDARRKEVSAALAREREHMEARLRKEIEVEVREKVRSSALEKARQELQPVISKVREESRRQVEQELRKIQQALALEQSRRNQAEAAVKKLQRKLSDISPQGRGIIAQEEVTQVIRAACPEDAVTMVPMGRRGGDILQEARDKGQVCGKILWEVKDTADWSDTYITKAKTDARRVGAEYVSIVTTSFPKGSDRLALRQGVILVAPELAGSLARLLRDALVDLTEARLAGEQRAVKASKILEYIGSSDCKSRFEAIADGLEELRKMQALERNYHDSHWAKEERIMSQIATASSGLRDTLWEIARETPVKLVAQA